MNIPLRNLISCWFGLLVVALPCRLTAREPLDRPNVVIIFLDDSGYGDYSFNGNPVIQTPNIDRLARGGVNFTQFYVSTAACSASRYALLTGRYPGRSGLGSWVIGPGAARHLHPQEVTIAEGLRGAGYATGMFGKWHLGNPNQGNNFSADALPLAHGFDTWTGTNVSHDYRDAKLISSDPEGDTPIAGYRELAVRLPRNQAVSTSLTGRYTDGAVDFIKANKSKPFFLYVAHNQPHLSLFAADPYAGTSRRGLLGDVMAEIDHGVGRIVKTLEEEGVAQNTLVIFTSDNGPWLRFREASKGERRLHVGYAYPFRDGKGSTWDGGFRVPGIFYWPGVIRPLRELRPASTLDVLPTVFALAGVDLPAGRTIDGRDIRPLLAPEKFDAEVPPFEFVYSYSSNDVVAIRRGPWKLKVKLGSQLGTSHGFKASKDHPLLFHLEHDLGERIDRSEELPEITADLRQRLLDKEAHIAEEGTFWDEQTR